MAVEGKAGTGQQFFYPGEPRPRGAMIAVGEQMAEEINIQADVDFESAHQIEMRKEQESAVGAKKIERQAGERGATDFDRLSGFRREFEVTAPVNAERTIREIIPENDLGRPRA